MVRIEFYLCDFSSEQIPGGDVAVAKFSYEVCTLGAFATCRATKYEHDLWVVFKLNFINGHILLSIFPDSLNILRAINLDDEFFLLVQLYDWL